MRAGVLLIGLGVIATAMIAAFTNLVQLHDLLGGVFFLALLLTTSGVGMFVSYERTPAWIVMPGLSWFPGLIAGWRGSPTAQVVLVASFCTFGAGVGLVLQDLLQNRPRHKVAAARRRRHRARQAHSRVIGSVLIAVWPLLGLLALWRAHLDGALLLGLVLAIPAAVLGVALGLWLIRLSKRGSQCDVPADAAHRPSAADPPQRE